MNETYVGLESVKWSNGQIDLLDQRLLPEEVVYLPLVTKEDVWEAIRHLKVRGAPAIGIAAAYGVVIASQAATTIDQWMNEVESSAQYLATSRPTAVNLFWALDRMKAAAAQYIAQGFSLDDCKSALEAEAIAIQTQD